jgi:predicted PurR-regulated permease PerM
MTKILNINKQNQNHNNINVNEDRKEKHFSKPQRPVVTIEFSWKFVSFVLAILALIFWGEQLVTVFVFLFLSIVTMSAVLPIINWLGKRKISKGWAIGITYFLGFILLLSITSLIFIPFINQLSNLGSNIPIWVEDFTSKINGINIGGISLETDAINKIITDGLNKLTSVDSFQKGINTVGGVFGWVSIILASIVFSVYLVLEHDKVLDFGLRRIISDEKRFRVKKLVLDLENKLGGWLLGQAAVSTIAGTTLGLILALFGIPFALPMGVLVALLSAIPSLGATVSSIPPLLIALITSGPITAFILLIIFLTYQQIENNFIIPKVMGTAAGVKPMFVLFSAIIFLILFGVWGAILSVPALVISKICYEFYVDLQKIDAKGTII